MEIIRFVYLDNIVWFVITKENNEYYVYIWMWYLWKSESEDIDLIIRNNIKKPLKHYQDLFVI